MTTILMLQPLHWRCVECVIHHERNVCEEQHHIFVARTSNNRVIAVHDLYCCLLPQCEALHTCHSSFPIAALEEIVKKHVNYLIKSASISNYVIFGNESCFVFLNMKHF